MRLHLNCRLPVISRFFPGQLCRQRSVGAIAPPSLIGFGALGVETGMWYRIKPQNQSAVDAAAISLQQSPVNPTALPPQFSLTSPARIGAPAVADPYAHLDACLSHDSHAPLRATARRR
jgi:hypothetical protein